MVAGSPRNDEDWEIKASYRYLPQGSFQLCSRAHTNGGVQQRTLLRRVLRRVLEIAFETFLKRVLRRCLAVGFNGKKGSEKGS